MPDIILSTLNAKYIHCGFGLRYLLANLGELQTRARIVELDIQQRPLEIVESLLAEDPKIIGFGVYIWNVSLLTEVVMLLKRVCPEVIVIVGGPEVSYEWEQEEIVRHSDYLIAGEADLEFAQLCRELLGGGRPTARIIRAPLPELEQLELPYAFYSDEDLSRRTLYVEASRGCPFSCEFCLSALDDAVRPFPLTRFLEEMKKLLARGARHFKFVDRTFNTSLKTAQTILEFFLDRIEPGMLLHFELVPDRLPEELRGIIARFPAGTLQFEVGIQTFNTAVAHNINRRQDYEALERNLLFLRKHTKVHLHADLIVGLPGETIESFGAGFDRLARMGPQEIQVGILKRLRGAPIARHDDEMVYSPLPPYEIVRNRRIDFAELQRMRRFARFWDLVANSGNFVDSAPLIWEGLDSPFDAFAKFSDWLYQQVGRCHGIALERLAEWVFIYLTQVRGLAAAIAAASLWQDWHRSGRCEKPAFLSGLVSNEEVSRARTLKFGAKRQARWAGPVTK